MSRGVFVLRDGKLVPKHLARPLHQKTESHYVISDGMEPAKNHADGRVYDSKRAFSKATRRAGCVEVGNEVMKKADTDYSPPGLPQDIMRAMEEINNRG